MRDGTELDFEGLRKEAAAAVEDAGRSQSEVARELDVHRSAVSRAVKESGPRLSELQRRIIRHLTPYRIERRVTFKAHKDAD